jgi:hypothetical protein
VRDARLRLAGAADGRRRLTRRRHWRHADLFSFHDLSKLAFKIVRLKKKFLQLTNHFRQAVGVEIGWPCQSNRKHYFIITKRSKILPGEFVGSSWTVPSSFEKDSKSVAAQTSDSPACQNINKKLELEQLI